VRKEGRKEGRKKAHLRDQNCTYTYTHIHTYTYIHTTCETSNCTKDSFDHKATGADHISTNVEYLKKKQLTKNPTNSTGTTITTTYYYYYYYYYDDDDDSTM